MHIRKVYNYVVMTPFIVSGLMACTLKKCLT